MMIRITFIILYLHYFSRIKMYFFSFKYSKLKVRVSSRNYIDCEYTVQDYDRMLPDIRAWRLFVRRNQLPQNTDVIGEMESIAI